MTLEHYLRRRHKRNAERTFLIASVTIGPGGETIARIAFSPTESADVIVRDNETKVIAMSEGDDVVFF